MDSVANALVNSQHVKSGSRGNQLDRNQQQKESKKQRHYIKRERESANIHKSVHIYL